jgi:hypothetical protein
LRLNTWTGDADLRLNSANTRGATACTTHAF